MTITEVKSDLHRLVVETDDMDILKAIQQVFSAMQKKKTDWFDLLPENQKQLIRKSLGEADRGDLIPQAKAHARIDAWVKANLPTQ